MKQILLAMAAVALKGLVAAASPEIRSFLTEKLQELKDKAEQTSNKFDDILADALYDIIVGQ